MEEIYDSYCYLPLYIFCERRFLLGAKLRRRPRTSLGAAGRGRESMYRKPDQSPASGPSSLAEQVRIVTAPAIPVASAMPTELMAWCEHPRMSLTCSA